MPNLSELIDQLVESRAAQKAADDSASAFSNPNLAGKIDDSVAGNLSGKDAAASASVLGSQTPPNFTIDHNLGQDLSGSAQAEAAAAKATGRAVPATSGLIPANLSKAWTGIGDDANLSKGLSPIDQPMVLRDVTPSGTSKLPVPYSDTAGIADITDEQAASNPVLAALKKAALPAAALGAGGLGAAALMGAGSGDSKAAVPPVAVPKAATVVPADDDSEDEVIPKAKGKVAAPVAKATDEEDDSDDDEEESPDKKDEPPVADEEDDSLPIDPSEATKANLLAAQHQRDSTIQQNQIGKALMQVGTSIALPGKELGDKTVFDQNIARADQPIKDLQARIDLEKSDPDSQYSSDLRDFMATKFGTQLPDTVSAAQVEGSMAKPLTALFEQSEKGKVAMAELASKLQAHHEDVQTQSETKLETARQHNELMAAMNADKKAAKETDTQTKAYTNLQKNNNTFRGNTAVQQAATALKNSESAMAIINSVPPDQYDHLDPQQYNLLTAEIAKIATGGAATEASSHDLRAQTAMSKAAAFWQSVSGKPTGAQLGEFVAQNKDYLNSLNDINQRWVDTFKAENYKAARKQMSPEDREEFETSHPGVMAVINGPAKKDTIAPPPQGGTSIPAAGTPPPTPKAQPKSVIQNGHTYNLNPTTGKYE